MITKRVSGWSEGWIDDERSSFVISGTVERNSIEWKGLKSKNHLRFCNVEWSIRCLCCRIEQSNKQVKYGLWCICFLSILWIRTLPLRKWELECCSERYYFRIWYSGRTFSRRDIVILTTKCVGKLARSIVSCERRESVWAGLYVGVRYFRYGRGRRINSRRMFESNV